MPLRQASRRAGSLGVSAVSSRTLVNCGLGLTGRWPRFQRVRQETVIAVNVGGCLIPASLAIQPGLFMNTCYVVRSSRPAWLFSFGLLDGLSVRTRRPYLREASAGFGLKRLATAFMNNPGWEIAHLLFDRPQSLPWLAIAVAANIAICYRLAQPISGVGIALPRLVPAATFDDIVLSGIVAAYLA